MGFIFRLNWVLSLTSMQPTKMVQRQTSVKLESNPLIYSDVSRYCSTAPYGKLNMERHVHHTFGVMVWGTIGYGGRTLLVFITRESFVKLRKQWNHTVFHILRGSKKLLFQQDNARRHVAKVTPDFLNEHKINKMYWI